LAKRKKNNILDQGLMEYTGFMKQKRINNGYNYSRGIR
jgi:hypothetical protein